jgi:hypothetical protein
VPSPLHVHEKAFAMARAHSRKVESMLCGHDMMRKQHSELEALLAEAGTEWARLMLEENLRLRALVEQQREVVDAEGKGRMSTRASARHLETVLGRVELKCLA